MSDSQKALRRWIVGPGASGPAPALYAHFGLTAEQLVQTVLRTIASSGGNDGDF